MRVWIAVASAVAGVLLASLLADHGHAFATSWWLGASTFIASLALVSRAVTRIALPIALVLLFAGLTTLRTLETPRDALPRISASDAVISVEGIVTSVPTAEPPPQGPLAPFTNRADAVTTWLAVSRVQVNDAWQPASGRLLLRTQGRDLPRAQPGDHVRVLGVYTAPRDRMNPGEPPRLRLAAQSGYVGVLDSSSPALLERIAAPQGLARLITLREHMRQRARLIFDNALTHADPESRALARSLLLGNTDDPASTDIAQTFTRLGLAHVLSISGFHLTVMALVALYLLRLTGDRGWIEPTLVAIAVLLYTLIVPFEAPIARSALMVLSLLLVDATGRRYDRVCVLGLITLALIAWRPLDVTNLGFQFSVGLTALLLWAAEPMQWRLFGQPVLGLIETRPTVFSQLFAGFKSSAAIALMCWLVSLPVLMYSTGLISPLGALATIVVSPLIVAALWAGYISVALGVIAPPLALPAAWVLQHVVSLSAWAARAIDAAPASSLAVPRPALWWTILATIALVVLVRIAHQLHWRTVALILALIAATGALSYTLRPSQPPLRVLTLAVGDGTCMLITSHDDALLWDCKTAPRAGVLPGIVAATRAAGVSRVPRVVITHPDIDHFAGLFDLLAPLHVEHVLVPPRFLAQAQQDPRGAAALIVRELAQRNITLSPITAGHTLELGPTRATFVAPLPAADFANDNDHSLVLLLETPSQTAVTRVLLTGDIGPQAITSLLASTTLPPLDALELPHHGSFNDASATLITHATPRIVLQSTGPRRLNDPRWLAPQHNRTWLITARDGAISLELTPAGTLRTRTFAPRPALP